MRKLGKQISQKGLGKKVKKSTNQLKAELTTREKGKKPIITNKNLAKKLGISDRTLRSYKNYFASLDNPKIKLGKHDRKPPKNILDKISKLASKKKIKKTRDAGKKYDKSDIDTITTLISDPTWNKLKKESQSKNWFGWLVRINILFITKQGSFDDWVTYVTSIKNKSELNRFIIGELQKLIESKNSILGFEIVEITINSTLQLKDKQ